MPLERGAQAVGRAVVGTRQTLGPTIFSARGLEQGTWLQRGFQRAAENDPRAADGSHSIETFRKR